MQKNKKNIKVMGILNLTQDSFFDGGKYFNLEKALKRALDICLQGAEIIDVGAESTRPFSEPVTLDEELSVLGNFLPSIIKISKEYNVSVSIDTYKSQVAKFAINTGATIINDVSGGNLDENMFEIVAKLKPYYVCGHIKGTPKNMQIFPDYKDVVEEVKESLNIKTKHLIDLGMPSDKIMLDPCIGFGKNSKHNMLLIKHIDEIKNLGFKTVIGLSRKKFIREIAENANYSDDFDFSLFGSLSANIFSALMGADIIRVHDVKETVTALKVISEILGTDYL